MDTIRALKPSHPGEVLRDMWEDIGTTQAQFAAALGVSRQTIAELLACRRNMSADMAHRLARALGGSPSLWMNLQQKVDLWNSEKANRRKYAKIAVLTTADGGHFKQQQQTTER